MKNIIVLIALMISAFSSNMMAQKQKIGHLNAQEIFDVMPEKDSLESLYEGKVLSLQKELEEMQLEYQRAEQNYISNEASWTDARKQIEQNTLQNMAMGIQAYNQTAQEEIQQFYVDLMAPTENKIKDAIKKVSEDNGFSYIIDISLGSVIYFDGGIDITDLVLKELGISSPIENNVE